MPNSQWTARHMFIESERALMWGWNGERSAPNPWNLDNHPPTPNQPGLPVADYRIYFQDKNLPVYFHQTYLANFCWDISAQIYYNSLSPLISTWFIVEENSRGDRWAYSSFLHSLESHDWIVPVSLSLWPQALVFW